MIIPFYSRKGAENISAPFFFTVSLEWYVASILDLIWTFPRGHSATIIFTPCGQEANCLGIDLK
jgi:hypothetical protein